VADLNHKKEVSNNPHSKLRLSRCKPRWIS